MPQALAPHTVHVHVQHTRDVSPDLRQRLGRVLSDDERLRAARFVHERDAHTYVLAHALLRSTLSRYASVAPEDWTFEANAYGKPAIAERSGVRLAFNLTHTDGLVACAVAPGPARLGVDAEPVDRHVPDLLDLARRFFSARELQQLEARPPDQRPLTFVELWTLKEAYVKAVGLGLSAPLSEFAFVLPDGRSLGFEPPLADDVRWGFALFAPTPAHRLAVAVDTAGTAVEIDVWCDGLPAQACTPLRLGP